MSFVHVNFDDPQATVVTKDAKVTPYSMIGSIGGTLGIFLGFSFVGLIDIIIHIIHQAIHKFKKQGGKTNVQPNAEVITDTK